MRVGLWRAGLTVGLTPGPDRSGGERNGAYTDIERATREKACLKGDGSLRCRTASPIIILGLCVILRPMIYVVGTRGDTGIAPGYQTVRCC
jgi:hypothetical protein